MTLATGLVYKIVHNASGRAYVGITRCALQKRWREHKCAAKSGSNRPLYRAMRKYGFDSFSISVLGFAESFEQLKLLECQFIKELQTFVRNGRGFNLTLGGDGLEKANTPRGVDAGNAVLTDAVVAYIRDPNLAHISNRLMVKRVKLRFGRVFNMDTLKAARQGKTWRHVSVPPVIVGRGSRKPALTALQREQAAHILRSHHAVAIEKSAMLSRGSRSKNAKLSVEQVKAIFFAKGSGPAIGAEFGVHKKVVYGIKNRAMHTYITRSL